MAYDFIYGNRLSVMNTIIAEAIGKCLRHEEAIFYANLQDRDGATATDEEIELHKKMAEMAMSVFVSEAEKRKQEAILQNILQKWKKG